MKYMGIDYGTKKTGIAFSDDAGTMGFPFGVKPTDPRLLDDLALLIKEKGVGAAVFGESTNFAGGENAVAAEAKAFAEDLRARTGIEIHFESEMFTTQAARRFPDGSRMQGSPDVDASAAALILTSYLERIVAPAIVLAPPLEEEPPSKYISIDDFAKVQVKVGTVLSAERVPETDKLLRLMVDLGEPEPRQIVSGISAYTEPEALVGRQLCFVANLAPRKIKGLESNGMLFAVGQGETFAFVTPDRETPPGTSAH
ncbi:MAG: methionyl-tRNA synthetase/methionyl-tRNA synthetase C-terminal region/beta chain [Parcubacteria group bacterium]|nr:methionyl-tRNA synthetase/methionyl-tRNA synthetase C-terminal region/beta chain [Parcubacteria group bacterium]